MSDNNYDEPVVNTNNLNLPVEAEMVKLDLEINNNYQQEYNKINLPVDTPNNQSVRSYQSVKVKKDYHNVRHTPNNYPTLNNNSHNNPNMHINNYNNKDAAALPQISANHINHTGNQQPQLVPLQKKTTLRKDNAMFKIPEFLDPCCCVAVLIINIFLPGWGTMFMGCCMCTSGMHPEDATALRCFFICSGILQFLFAVCIIGWVWAILTGVYLVQASCSKSAPVTM